MNLPCATVNDLIQLAYGSKPYAFTVLRVWIDGGPGWINSERYTIHAKAEGNPSASVMSGPMLQALLADRFNLKIRRETRQVPVFELKVAKNGARLQPFEEGSCIGLTPGAIPPGQKPFCGIVRARKNGANLTVELFDASLDELSKNLGIDGAGQILDRPVIDKTGATGLFNFRLQFAPDESMPTSFQQGGAPNGAAGPLPSDPAGPSIFTAIQEQLGLKLEAAKGPGEFLVIDRVQRPSEN